MARLRIIPYLVSQYVWLIVACLPFLYFLTKRSKVMTNNFTSFNNPQKFNDSYKPSWFLHGTDLHVNSIGNKSYLSILNQLNKSINLFKPKMILLSGDLVDNRNAEGKRPFTHMVKSDWDAYEKILSELKLDGDPRLAQVAGNHDFFDLVKFSSENHYGNGVLYNYSTFQTNRIPLDIDGVKASLLTINPFQFPAPPLRQTWFTSPTKSVLNKVENAISENKDDIQIIMQHHPSRMWFPNKGILPKNSYMQFLKTTKNVRLIICGHRHPKHPVQSHFGNVFEVIGTPWFRYENLVGLITYDNRRLAYHEVDISKKHVAVMTYPSDDSQTSNLDDFSLNSFNVRALSFGKTPGNLSVTGAVNGTLSCKEIENQIWLCQMPVKLDNGLYTIQKTGDWSGNVTFTVGSTIKGFEEENYLSEHSISYTLLFGWLLLFTVIITLTPAVLFKDKLKKVDQWIMGITSSEPHWAFACLGGPILISYRLSNTHITVKLLSILMGLWPIVLPLNFFDIEKSLSMFWAWGFISDGKAIMGFEGMMFGIYFIIFTIFPFLLISSSICTTRCFSWIHYVELLGYFATFYGCYEQAYLLWDWFGLQFALTSPAYIILPIVGLIFTIHYIIVQCGNRQIDTVESYDNILIETQ